MPDVLEVDELAAAICALDPGMVDSTNWGERALFFNPGGLRKKGIYVATFKLRDGANDNSSRLGDGAGRYRFNIQLSRPDYEQHFGPKPPRPPAGGVVSTGHDFAIENVLMPHPVYAWMHWAAIINPASDKRDALIDYASRALDRARKRPS